MCIRILYRKTFQKILSSRFTYAEGGKRKTVNFATSDSFRLRSEFKINFRANLHECWALITVSFGKQEVWLIDVIIIRNYRRLWSGIHHVRVVINKRAQLSSPSSVGLLVISSGNEVSLLVLKTNCLKDRLVDHCENVGVEIVVEANVGRVGYEKEGRDENVFKTKRD